METRYRLSLSFFLCLLQVSVLSANSWKSTIIVSPSGTSLSCGSAASPCKTLDLAIQTAMNRGMNFTRVLLKQGKYKLEKTYVFTSTVNVSLVGENAAVAIQCSSNVSLAFLLSQNVELHNLKFMKCGGWQKSLVGSKGSSGEVQYMEYITGLYFNYVKNLQISNVEVSESNGVGITLNDVGGIINITGSVFVNNSPRQVRIRQVLVNNQTSMTGEDNKRAHTGGGIFLLLNSYGYNPINISRQTHDTYQHNNQYLFADLKFLGNKAESPGLDVKMNTPLVPFSRGGGLGIYLFGNASGNAFTISRCEFVGNRAQWGGGLQVEFKHTTQSNAMRVQESTFKENYASFAGGGARFGDLTISKHVLKPNTFRFDDCQFLNNTSLWGGGSSMYGTTFMGEVESNAREKFLLNNCRWRENRGTVGSAIGVFLFNLNDDSIGPYQSVHVVLENCKVVNNEVITQEEDVLIGQGAVYTVEVPLIFKGNISIANNTNTGMVLDSAMAVIDGQVEFSHNKGYSGGALALYGNSRVRFNKNSKLAFISNECADKGGAMYIYAPGPPQVSFNATGYSTHQCFFDYFEQFIDYDKWETEIVFQDNRAPNEESGLSLYATTLQNCRRVGEKRKNNTVLQWRIIRFLDASGKNRTSVNKEVSTDPVDITFEEKDWNVGASESFNASVALLDEKGNPVNGMVDVSMLGKESSAKVRLSTPSSLFLVNNETIPFLSLAGKGGERYSVALRSMGGHQLRKVFTNLTLRACNPGFHSQEDKCVCSDTILKGISRCGNDGRSVYLKRGYWAGTFEGHFYTATCPVNYCNCPDPLGSNLVGECTYIQSQICIGNRDSSSVLCGRCKPGYTAGFGSDDCVEDCSSFNLFYFILIAFIFLLLVMFVMTINVDVFTGYLNAWLYSYQVITLITPGTFAFDKFMTFVIGLANVEFRIGGSGICFTKGIDEADELLITYILPAYILILVYIIAKVVRRFPNWRYSRKVKSPFSALCTLFVLCYTNITGISLRILDPVEVGDKMQLFSQGELGFFKGKHIAYGIIAIVFILLVVVMVPFQLICQTCVAKCLRRIKVNAQNLKPFFDKLQGCFKDKYRWCAAFYFLSRLLILLLDTYVSRSPLKRALLEGACVLILTVFVYLRPYKEGRSENETSYDWINLSDAVLLTNLTVIAIFSSVIEESPSASTRRGVGIFINFLAYVPLAVLAAVLYKAFQQYSENRKKEGKEPLKIRFSQLLPNRKGRDSEVSETTDDPKTDCPTNTAGYRTSTDY